MKKETKWKLIAALMLFGCTFWVGLVDYSVRGTICGVTLIPSLIFLISWGSITVVEDVIHIKDELYPLAPEESEDE